MHYLYFGLFFFCFMCYFLVSYFNMSNKKWKKGITSLVMSLTSLCTGAAILVTTITAISFLMYVIWGVCFALEAYWDYKENDFNSALANTIFSSVFTTLILITLWILVLA